jgi:WD40 repeat protein
MECIQYKEAHDAEILTISYSSNRQDELMLATGGRDRLIHIFDANDNYNILTTLDDHSSSITSLKFVVEGTKLLSCGADKSVIFRNITRDPFTVSRYHQAIVQYGTVYDMDVDPVNKFIVTSGQDKKLSIYAINTGKPARSYKVEETSGEVIKVRLDPAGIYAATSSSDKNIRLYDYWTGECLAKLSGHSEVVTGLVFTPNCKRLISVSGDSCIFIWRLSQKLTSNIQERLAELKLKSIPPSVPKISPIQSESQKNIQTTIISADDVDLQIAVQNKEDNEDFSLDDNNSSLPSWAKGNRDNKSQPEKFTAPRGRWAQRVNPTEGVPLFSELSDVEKPIAKMLDAIERRYTIEITQEDKENFLGTWRLAKQFPPTSETQQEENSSKKYEIDSNDIAPIRSTSPQLTLPGRPSMAANQPAPEDEDAVLYASDPEDEVEDDPTNNPLALDAEAETEYYGQSPRSTPAFESAIQLVDAKVNVEKQEEEVNTEDVEEATVEDFQDPEKADFLKSNYLFDANNIAANKMNVARLSISSIFLLRPPQDVKQAADNTKNLSKKQDAAFAKELAKTKQRLAQMNLTSSTVKPAIVNELPEFNNTEIPTSPASTNTSSLNTSEIHTSAEDNQPAPFSPMNEETNKENDEDIEDDLKLLKESLTNFPSNEVPSTPKSIIGIESPTSTLSPTKPNPPSPTAPQYLLPLPVDYYSKSLLEFQSSFDNIISLYKEVLQSNKAHPNDSSISSLLSNFTDGLQLCQQNIASSLVPSLSLNPSASTTLNSSNLLLTQNLDKTLELYSNMLLQVVKDKLDKKL